MVADVVGPLVFTPLHRTDPDMGLIRKSLSLGTMGLIDARSAKDRTAAYARGTRSEARKQTKIMRRQAKAARGGEVITTAPVAPSRGWYPHPFAPGHVAYWNGKDWVL